MPGPSYTLPIRVRLYDLDVRDEVSSATLLRYFEETAIQASSQLGFTLDWYNERGQFWVIRTIKLERNGAARYEDELQVRTWVSLMTRVRADRNYLVRRVADGRILARATANWVYLDRETMRPARIAPDIVAMFKNPDPPPFTAAHSGRTLAAVESPVRGVTFRRAQYFEADSAKHTNNAIYVDWLEEAVRDTLSACGHKSGADAMPSIWFYRHFLEYLTPALPGDDVEITTRLASRGKTGGLWRQEIRRAKTREIVARAESTTCWLDEQNHPVRWTE